MNLVLMPLFFCSLFGVVIVLVTIIPILIVSESIEKNYTSNAYYQVTKTPYKTLKNNPGQIGEYLVYTSLKHFETKGAKFLFNVYVPKEDGKTTEIDVLMICSKGLMVFESKNYSGWIFGSENQKYWYQTLRASKYQSRKEPFYNPIMQNRSHINHLKALLGEHIWMWSIIAFSDVCTFKKLNISSNDVSVIKRRELVSVVNRIYNSTPADVLNESDIENIYNILYPYTQVDDTLKARHIEHINSFKPQTIQQNAPYTIIESHTPSALTFSPNKATTRYIVPPQFKEENANHVTDAFPPQQIKCPMCGSQLILRAISQDGYIDKLFYDCSNYPNCLYMQSAPE